MQAAPRKLGVAPSAPHRHLTRRSAAQLPVAAPMAIGAAMIVWSGAIHLDLWDSGYRSVPTIGTLFLFQAVTAFVLGGLVLVTRRVVPAAAGALFLASTAAGLVWSVEWGLFGFKDSFGAPFASESLGVEAAGVVVLAIASAARRWQGRRRRDERTPTA
jgi:hypothetical protein